MAPSLTSKRCASQPRCKQDGLTSREGGIHAVAVQGLGPQRRVHVSCTAPEGVMRLCRGALHGRARLCSPGQCACEGLLLALLLLTRSGQLWGVEG